MTEVQEVYALLLARGYQEKLFTDLSDRRKQGADLVDRTLLTRVGAGRNAYHRLGQTSHKRVIE